MINALLYLQWQSFLNRTVRRVKRLRQPKYLIGALVGGLYFYWYFFRYLLGNSQRRSGFSSGIGDDQLLMLETLGALALAIIVLLSWMIPHRRTALVFTEAEISFLFPAPVSRRTLIHFKLLKSQTAILITTLFLTLITGRFGTSGNGLLHAAGWWLILSTLNLHFLGTSFVRTTLLEHGITNWKRRLAVMGIVSALGLVGYFTAQVPWRPLAPSDIETFQAFADYLQELFGEGPLGFALLPFRWMVRPFLSGSPQEFFKHLLPAAGLLVAHYIWVVRANVSFEESSVELSRRFAERVASARAGNFNTPSKKARRPPFTLQPLGHPAVAFLWKNLISAGNLFTPRMFTFLLIMTLPMSVVTLQMPSSSGMLPMIGILFAMLTFWSSLLGPQLLRQDLRQDMAAMDILKTYPLRGWQVVLGEILAPICIITALQWLLLVMTAFLLSEFPPGTALFWPWRVSGVIGGIIIVPFLNGLCLLIPNAAALVFPAWFQTGREAPHGLEATGQRLVFVVGQMFVFLLALVPAVAGFLALFFPFYFLLGPIPAIPMGATGAALVLAGEAALGLLLLGRQFEKFDLSAEN